MLMRSRNGGSGWPAAVTILALAQSAWAGGTLRVALTATDVPTTTGSPDNGGEGIRFLGFPVFESLVLWDLTRADKLAEIRPGLAESWEQDKDDPTKWIFHLRRGVKFHDGTDWNADAAIWNLDRFLKSDSPQFDPPNAAVTQARNPYYANYRKIDEYTIEIGNRGRSAISRTWSPGRCTSARRSSRRLGHGRNSPRHRRERARSRSSIQAAGQREFGSQRGILG